MQKVIAKINLQAIKDNARAFKELTGKRLCAVVKANAYGHGDAETVNALSKIADSFAVAIVEEGLKIRQAACGKEILVLTPPSDETEVLALLENSFSATVGDLYTARLVARIAKYRKKEIKVHLKINTGMNRYGMDLLTLGKACKFLLDAKNVQVVGAYSHLFGVDESSAAEQRAKFVRAQRICERYFSNLCYHLSATFGALLGEDYGFDMVRVGLGLYGYLPTGLAKREKTLAKGLKLKKAMKVYAKTIAIRRYAGGGIGYGVERDQDVPRSTQLSVLRYGYADGFLRKPKNGTPGAEKNAAPLCMDACIRFERKGRGKYVCVLSDAEKTAAETGTIAYEVLCAATKRAEFIYEK